MLASPPSPATAEPLAAEVEMGERLYVIVESGKWGYMNRDGEVVVPPSFDFATPFFDGRAKVRMEEKWGFIAPDGSWVVRPTYDDVGVFSEGRALVSVVGRNGQRFGFIDVSGHEVIEPSLTYALDYQDGLALIRTGYQYGNGGIQSFLSRFGVLPPSSGFGFIDRDGDLVVEVPGLSAASYSNGLAPFERSRGWFRSSTWGYLDRTGQVAVEPTLDGPAFRHTEGLARVGDDGKVGFVDREGAFVIAPEYTFALGFSEGMAPVQLDGRWGYVDPAGDLMIPSQFIAALPFSEGLAAVKTDDGWGYIDPTGTFVIPAGYSKATSFDRGLARVFENRLLRYIDTDGETVWAQR